MREDPTETENTRNAIALLESRPAFTVRKLILAGNAKAAMKSINASTDRKLPPEYRALCGNLLEKIAALREEDERGKVITERGKLEKIVGKLLYFAFTLRENRKN